MSTSAQPLQEMAQSLQQLMAQFKLSDDEMALPDKNTRPDPIKQSKAFEAVSLAAPMPNGRDLL